MFCCQNTVYNQDFYANFTTQTVKFPDLSRFWLAMLGFGPPNWKDPRQQSTKVEKYKVDGPSCKKHQKIVNRSNSDEVTPFLGLKGRPAMGL